MQLYEKTGPEEYLSKLDLIPDEDGLLINHVLYSDTVSEDHVADVYTSIDLPFAFIDSVHSMYCYFTMENNDLQYRMAQEIGDDIYSVADRDIEYDFIYTPRQ